MEIICFIYLYAIQYALYFFIPPLNIHNTYIRLYTFMYKQINKKYSSPLINYSHYDHLLKFFKTVTRSSSESALKALIRFGSKGQPSSLVCLVLLCAPSSPVF